MKKFFNNAGQAVMDFIVGLVIFLGIRTYVPIVSMNLVVLLALAGEALYAEWLQSNRK